MLSKKTLKTIHAFNQEQSPGPSFILIYVLTWIAWHNTLFTSFFNADGGFGAKYSTAMASFEENQYLLVLLFTLIIFFIRLGVNFLKFKSGEYLNSTDEDFTSFKDDQIYPKDSDIGKLMATFEKTKKQLADTKEREKKVIDERNKAIQKSMSLEHELEEAKAEIDILTKSLTP